MGADKAGNQGAPGTDQRKVELRVRHVNLRRPLCARDEELLSPDRPQQHGRETARVDSDAIADLYDSTPDRTKPVDPEPVAFLRERPSAAGLAVLDIGCETGNQLIANGGAVQAAHIVGVNGFAGMP
jgi:hypothetical protein